MAFGTPGRCGTHFRAGGFLGRRACKEAYSPAFDCPSRQPKPQNSRPPGPPPGGLHEMDGITIPQKAYVTRVSAGSSRPLNRGILTPGIQSPLFLVGPAIRSLQKGWIDELE